MTWSHCGTVTGGEKEEEAEVEPENDLEEEEDLL
jgi:hypothetical protein